MSKKYKLTTNTKYELFQIKALRDIPRFGVRKGDLGGYIESDKNLSHDDDAWVFGDAIVFGNAEVSGNARVLGDAWVFGDAIVFGNAEVSGNARVFGDAIVFGNAEVSGNARVFGDAWVFGNASVTSDFDIVNIGIPQSYSITILPDVVNIGRTSINRKDLKKITKKKAVELGLKAEYYTKYKHLIEAGLKFVKYKPSKERK